MQSVKSVKSVTSVTSVKSVKSVKSVNAAQHKRTVVLRLVVAQDLAVELMSECECVNECE